MDKQALQDSFIKLLIEKSRYPEDSIYKDWKVTGRNGVSITLDIAIVVNGIVIQSFTLFEKGQDVKTQTYTQTIDSVSVQSKTVAAVYNTEDDKWNEDLFPNSISSSGKCFMLYANAGKKLIKKVKEQQSQILISDFKDRCTLISRFCIAYIVLYIFQEICRCKWECGLQLPLSWEFLALLSLIILLCLLPVIVPLIQVIKIGNVEVQMLTEEFSKYQ